MCDTWAPTGHSNKIEQHMHEWHMRVYINLAVSCTVIVTSSAINTNLFWYGSFSIYSTYIVTYVTVWRLNFGKGSVKILYVCRLLCNQILSLWFSTFVVQ